MSKMNVYLFNISAQKKNPPSEVNFWRPLLDIRWLDLHLKLASISDNRNCRMKFPHVTWNLEKRALDKEIKIQDIEVMLTIC